MSNDCEDIRLILVESAYDEIDPTDEDALEAHLRECEECARRRDAFRAVRADLGAWDRVEASPTRVTFVGGTGPVRGTSRLRGMRPWQRALATAASFTLGFLLIAAAVNLELQRDESGWTLRTSLLPRSSEAVPDAGRQTTGGPVERIGGEEPRPAVPVGQPADGRFQVMSPPELDSWLNQRLEARGAGIQPRPEQIQPILDKLLRERERQFQAAVREMLANAQASQEEKLEEAVTGLYQTFDAQRTNDLLFFASELGLLQEATGMELQQTNAAIDYLISLEAQEQMSDDVEAPRRPPER